MNILIFFYRSQRHIKCYRKQSFSLAVKSLPKVDSRHYYIHFEIIGYPCNLIGSQQCDLFPNRTIFCSKSHFFLSQWEWDSKTKQPIRFQGFLKLTNHIAGKWRQKGHCLANLTTFVVLVVLVVRILNSAISKWM